MRRGGLMRIGRGIRRAVPIAIVVGATTAGISLAAPVSINDVVLETSSPTTRWDPQVSLGDNYLTECKGLSGDTSSYTPVADGNYDGVNDAFDSGLVLSVGAKPYTDSDSTGNLVGEQLKTGPAKFGKLKVSRMDRALSPGTTLRSLIKLKNKSRRKAVKRTVTFGSNMGSDENTDVRDTSAPPFTSFRPDDRWVVSSELADNPDDPPVVHALFGKGTPQERPTAVLHDLAVPDATC